jgi:CBS domain-containing protein
MANLFESLPSEFVSKTEFFDYKTPVTQTLDKVKKLGAVVILKNGEYYGVVDDRSIFRTRTLKPLNFSKSFSIGKFARKLPVLDSSTSLNRLIGYFHEFSAKAFPYQEGKRITGVVKREVALSTILSLHIISKVKVSDAMSTPVIAIDSKANVAQAASTMEKNRIARLIVLDAGRLVGLISMRDILDNLTNPQQRPPQFKSSSFSLSNVPVQNIMRAPVYIIDYGMPTDSAIRQLLENRISSLVVTRNNRPVGIISVRDIIEAAAATTAKVQSRVMISGLDSYTKEYEESMQTSINALIDKINKFEKLTVDYVSLNVKWSRERNYEMKARLALQKKGAIFVHVTGYNLESTLSDLIEKIYKRIKERKEFSVSMKREAYRYYGE